MRISDIDFLLKSGLLIFSHKQFIWQKLLGFAWEGAQPIPLVVVSPPPFGKSWIHPWGGGGGGGGGCITTMYVSLQLKFQLDSPAYSPCPYPDPAFVGLLQQAALRCNVGGVWELLKCCVDHYKIKGVGSGLSLNVEEHMRNTSTLPHSLLLMQLQCGCVEIEYSLSDTPLVSLSPHQV